MSNQDTDPDAPAVNLPDGVVSGESTPPDEHTMRVRARSRQAEPPTKLEVHDDAMIPAVRSSTEMADRSKRHRRRERDRKAERRAIQMIVGLFVGLGGAAFIAVNLLVDDSVTPPPPAPPPGEQVLVPPPAPPNGVISTTIDESPDIPALRKLKAEGLTIVAEGIPQVDAVGLAGGQAAALAALETCRFSYAVWEFSPNRRFRFLSTCDALEGQVMFGAYEIQGGVVRLSPLVTDTDAVVSEFTVERPSKMTSSVSRRVGGPTVLTIKQKVTNMRPGMDGDAWRDAYTSKNTINLPKKGRLGSPPPRRAPPAAPPPAKKKGKDPLLDLLKKNG